MKKVFGIVLTLVLLVGLGLVTATPVLADVIDVPGDYPTIQAAINASAIGDTIMVAGGEYDAFLVQGKSNISIIGAEGATITTAEVFSIDVGPIGEAWAMGAVKDSENINIEGINFDGTEVGIEDWVVGIAYVDSTGGIVDVTLENILGTELAAGVAILGYEGTSVVDLSGVTVENSLAGVIIWDAESNLGGCTISGNLLAGIVVGIPEEEWWGPSTVNIRGSTISNHEGGVGIWVSDDSTSEIHFNNIAGNSFGLWNDGSQTVDAAYNWWGDASGPYHGTLNPDGMGDEVSDNVDFEPWLESASVTQTVTDGIFDAIHEAATMVEVHNGTVMVTISKYEGNPYPDAPIVGDGELASLDVGTLQTEPVPVEDSFIDVLVTYRTVGTYVTIKIYYTEEQIKDIEEGTLRACWTNEVDPEYYQRCSNSNVVTSAQHVGGNDYSGYIWAIIDDGSSPSMDQLNGTTFGGYGSGSQLPEPCGCSITTAAYGTDTAAQLDILREFRDRVLMPNSLGARLVSLYYRTSPPIAGFISQHEVLRTAVRVGFVDPIVKVSTWTHALW